MDKDDLIAVSTALITTLLERCAKEAESGPSPEEEALLGMWFEGMDKYIADTNEAQNNKVERLRDKWTKTS